MNVCSGLKSAVGVCSRSERQFEVLLGVRQPTSDLFSLAKRVLPVLMMKFSEMNVLVLHSEHHEVKRFADFDCDVDVLTLIRLVTVLCQKREGMFMHRQAS